MIVSKSWRALISNDPLFALDQSRHPSPISSAFVYLSLRGLEFLQLPNTPVGVPDPSLSMLQYSDRVGLVASTNGLLCLYAHGNILYLVNPATENRPERIPCRRSSWKRHCCVGLAFDPSVSATHYTLVYPHREHTNLDADEVEYWFEVFTSGGDRNWVASSQRVTVRGFHWCHETAVFAGGVLYWDCTEYLIWFDPCKDLAGWMLMPTTMTPAAGARHALGASELGRLLTCTVMVEEAVEVFVMAKKNAGEWTRRHRVSLQAMIERNPEVFAEFCNTMRLRSRSLSERLFSRWNVQPLTAFEGGGGKVYFWVRARKGKGEEKERVLCYDVGTGELALISNGVSLAPWENRIFPYHNSMARLPN